MAAGGEVAGKAVFFAKKKQKTLVGAVADPADDLRAAVRARTTQTHPIVIASAREAIQGRNANVRHAAPVSPRSADFSERIRDIKAGSTRRIEPQTERTIGTLRQRESGIWQRRFWEHTMRDERDDAAHMDDNRFNPVEHGLVKNARAWESTSLRRCVAIRQPTPSPKPR